MSLFKSNGFNLAGTVYEKGESLCDEDFPTKDHIKICLEKSYVTKVSDEDIENAEIEEIETAEEAEEDIYDSMEKPELIEELVSLGYSEGELSSKQAKTLRKMLRDSE